VREQNEISLNNQSKIKSTRKNQSSLPRQTNSQARLSRPKHHPPAPGTVKLNSKQTNKQTNKQIDRPPPKLLISFAFVAVEVVGRI
jgi:hypothetical protein